MSDIETTIPPCPNDMRLDSLVVSGKFKGNELCFAICSGDRSAALKHIEETLPQLFFALWQAHHVREADTQHSA